MLCTSPFQTVLDGMSKVTYPIRRVEPIQKPLVWLHGEVRTPPFSPSARVEAGYLLRLIQGGTSLGRPRSRPLPSIGARCHELRVVDAGRTWRIIYYVDSEAIVILEVFQKQTPKTPQEVLDVCRSRLRRYNAESR